MSFECLKSDKRRKGVLSDWEIWLREADRLYCRYLEEIEESPFNFNEVSAVGFLSSAAARSGFLTLNEYEIIKRDQSDRRRKRPGRADLWLNGEKRSYSFEFKRAWHAATIHNLESTLSSARGDIDVVDKDESHYAAGVVLAYVRDEHRIERYRNFAQHESVDVAYRIGPDGEAGGYLFFSIKG
ncbi:hypothetical protein HZF05_19350 [Sphingomonas sp. CGMCC 1.13654]|uniref:Uncharacterized protein n=1 Tax=Sphingomonas chungangi TaxID=2683589 RepID=A0A838L9Z4_9SPHN|nr:hypothetical protein [Sphingomonas chungangi]MBA2936243.1 hypothetical protein [Sphingomonas chungangi]MVW55628.1 hypothetical protein [Sphingomonas chungangi]